MINETIKEARKAAKITQEQLSKQVKIPVRRIIAIEAGTGTFTLPELTKILTALSLTAIIIPKSCIN